MRGTDNAALASVLGALADAAADGDPTETDTVMKYMKQIINILVGTVGIVAFPNEAAPANNVSLAEVIRAIHSDVTGLNGAAMRGTDGANTVVPDAAGTLATYDPPTKTEMDSAFTEIKGSTWSASTDTLEHIRDKETDIETDTNELQTDLADGGRIDLLIDAIKAKTDDLPSGITKNVALSNFTFYMVLASDHVTAATGKTVTATISKDGGAFASCTNSVSEIASGLYKINLTQTEMNADTITLKFSETDCDTRIITIETS